MQHTHPDIPTNATQCPVACRDVPCSYRKRAAKQRNTRTLYYICTNTCKMHIIIYILFTIKLICNYYDYSVHVYVCLYCVLCHSHACVAITAVTV